MIISVGYLIMRSMDRHRIGRADNRRYHRFCTSISSRNRCRNFRDCSRNVRVRHRLNFCRSCRDRRSCLYNCRFSTLHGLRSYGRSNHIRSCLRNGNSRCNRNSYCTGNIRSFHPGIGRTWNSTADGHFSRRTNFGSKLSLACSCIHTAFCRCDIRRNDSALTADCADSGHSGNGAWMDSCFTDRCFGMGCSLACRNSRSSRRNSTRYTGHRNDSGCRMSTGGFTGNSRNLSSHTRCSNGILSNNGCFRTGNRRHRFGIRRHNRRNSSTRSRFFGCHGCCRHISFIWNLRANNRTGYSSRYRPGNFCRLPYIKSGCCGHSLMSHSSSHCCSKNSPCTSSAKGNCCGFLGCYGVGRSLRIQMRRQNPLACTNGNSSRDRPPLFGTAMRRNDTCSRSLGNHVRSIRSNYRMRVMYSTDSRAQNRTICTMRNSPYGLNGTACIRNNGTTSDTFRRSR